MWFNFIVCLIFLFSFLCLVMTVTMSQNKTRENGIKIEPRKDLNLKCKTIYHTCMHACLSVHLAIQPANHPYDNYKR